MEGSLRIIRPNIFESCMNCPIAEEVVVISTPVIEGGVLTEVAIRCVPSKAENVVYMSRQTTESVEDYKGQGPRIVIDRKESEKVDCPGLQAQSAATPPQG